VLADELCAFCVVIDKTSGSHYQDGFLSLLASQCVARSALFVALDAFTCPEKIGTATGYINSTHAKTPAELNLQAYSINIIQQVSEQARSFVKEVMSMMEMEAKLVHLRCCILYHSDIPLVFGRKRVGRVSDWLSGIGYVFGEGGEEMESR
jgi:hypothetical protein